MKDYKQIFKDSLQQNHPTFVGYMLAAGFDPCILIGINDGTERETVLLQLYRETHTQMHKV